MSLLSYYGLISVEGATQSVSVQLLETWTSERAKAGVALGAQEEERTKKQERVKEQRSKTNDGNKSKEEEGVKNK